MSGAVLRVGIFGRGRLGSTLAEHVGRDPSTELGFYADRRCVLDQLEQVDVAIDASLGEAVPVHVDWALATSTPLVIGSTGWSNETLARDVGRRIGVMLAPNGSLLVALFEQFAAELGRFVGADSDTAGFLVEHHHAAKQDAPSGTALRLGLAFKSGAGTCSADLPIQSVRAGSELGLHRLGVDLTNETLEITHRVRDRSVFAVGLLTGARWLAQPNRTGLFTLADVTSGR